MTKTRSIISETIIGKDEPLQPFRATFLRQTAADMRSKRNLRGAMELEKIANEQEGAALHQEDGKPHGSA